MNYHEKLHEIAADCGSKINAIPYGVDDITEYTEEEASEICKDYMTKVMGKVLNIDKETALKILEGGEQNEKDN